MDVIRRLVGRLSVQMDQANTHAEVNIM